MTFIIATQAEPSFVIECVCSITSGLSALGIMFIQLRWMRRRQQSGVIFDPFNTILDIMAPWVVAMFLIGAAFLGWIWSGQWVASPIRRDKGRRQ